MYRSQWMMRNAIPWGHFVTFFRRLLEEEAKLAQARAAVTSSVVVGGGAMDVSFDDTDDDMDIMPSITGSPRKYVT